MSRLIDPREQHARRLAQEAVFKKVTQDRRSQLSEAGRKGAAARNAKLSPERRREIARLGGQASARDSDGRFRSATP